MDDKPEFFLVLFRSVTNSNSDPLADASKFAHRAAFNRRDRRVHSAKDKNALQTHVLQPLADNPRLKRRDVGRDVGQFRHCYQLAAKALAGATIFLADYLRIVLSISRVGPT